MLKHVSNSRRDLPRFSVIVSKKVYKSAVKRNRIRRRLYEIIRNYINSKDNVNSIDVMINVYSPEVLTLKAKILESEVLGLLKQSGL